MNAYGILQFSIHNDNFSLANNIPLLCLFLSNLQGLEKQTKKKEKKSDGQSHVTQNLPEELTPILTHQSCRFKNHIH